MTERPKLAVNDAGQLMLFRAFEEAPARPAVRIGP
jgi:hypothetical protein